MEVQYGYLFLANYQHDPYWEHPKSVSQEAAQLVKKEEVKLVSQEAKPVSARAAALCRGRGSFHTCNEPAIAPAHPLPLPTSRFFADPRRRPLRAPVSPPAPPAPTGIFSEHTPLQLLEPSGSATLAQQDGSAVTRPQAPQTPPMPFAASPRLMSLPCSPVSAPLPTSVASPRFALTNDAARRAAAAVSPDRQTSSCSTDTPSRSVSQADQLPNAGGVSTEKPFLPEDAHVNDHLSDEQTVSASPPQSSSNGPDHIGRFGEHKDEGPPEPLEPGEHEDDERQKPNEVGAPARQEEEEPPQEEAPNIIAPVSNVVTVEDKRPPALQHSDTTVSLLCTRIDEFFNDAEMWREIQEVARMNSASKLLMTTREVVPLSQATGVGPLGREDISVAADFAPFRVDVPRPYPGVQYRKSKRLDDRYPRYAQKGSEVWGVIEEDGRWLRTNGYGFLPMNVGDTRVIVPLDPQVVKQKMTRDAHQNAWSLCCAWKPVEPAWQPSSELMRELSDSGSGKPDPYKKVI